MSGTAPAKTGCPETTLTHLLARDVRPPAAQHLRAGTIPELNAIISALETDEQVKVVVFDTAVDEHPNIHANICCWAGVGSMRYR